MIDISGYKIFEKIYQGGRSVVYRGHKIEGNIPVIIKVPKSEYPDPDILERIEYEFDIIKGLKHDGIIKAYSLELFSHSKALILEDFNGVSLKDLVDRKKLQIGEIILLGIRIAEILEKIHDNGIIYKNLNPGNILIGKNVQDIKLIDFSIASLVQREMQTVVNPEKLEGDILYISPEQTGRMNRTIDLRSDFYSLGVILYELLTNRPLYKSDDPIGIIHSHIAREIIPPHRKNKEVPHELSDIIVKLLAKTAENRYQSAYGIIYDLRKCYSILNSKDRPDSFNIGEKDISDLFQISEKIYGRENEIRTLLSDFKETLSGNFNIIMFTGPPGIGKSSIINEIHKSLTESKGSFISGKFDKLDRAVPYEPIIKAFNNLIHQLLTESEEKIVHYRNKILSSLGDNGQVIIDVLPDLELIIGRQNPIPKLNPQKQQNRFINTFCDFIKVFANKINPLVLFLDDLQWADNASINLINVLLSKQEISYFLFIGAYRDNEVDPKHPVNFLFKDLNEKGIELNIISLEPLNKSQINLFISETLHQETSNTEKFAALVKEKTGGNPFFVKEFMINLHRENLIKYDNGWHFDLEKIAQVDVTGNIIEFITDKIKKLPPDVLGVLKVASCIGHVFDLKILSAVCSISEEKIFSLIKISVGEGIIIKLKDNYKFIHDRVCEAVYSIIGNDEKVRLHYSIGRIMHSGKEREKIDEMIFAVVHHLNLSRKLITDINERSETARLNLIAGLKAKSSAAFERARDLFKAGTELLPNNSWETDYDLTLSLFIELGESGYLCGNYEEVERYFNEVLDNAETILDAVRVYEIKMDYFTTIYKADIAIKMGREALNILGLKIPKRANPFIILTEIIKSQLYMRKRNISELEEIPILDDPNKLAIARILMSLSKSAYIQAPDYFPIIIMKLLNFSFKNGISVFTSYSYITYAILVCHVLGDIEKGYELSLQALKILDKFNGIELRSKVYFIFGSMINHWKRHVSEDTEYFINAYKNGYATGDFSFASYALNHYMFQCFFSGKRLNEVKREFERHYLSLKNLQQLSTAMANDLWYQVIINLSGGVEDLTVIKGEKSNEDELIPQWINMNEKTNLGFYTVGKMILCYIFNDYKKSIEIALKGKEYLSSVMGMFFVPEYYFYYSLSMISYYPEVSNRQKRIFLRRIKKHLKKMKKWASHAPMNFKHKYLLIEAGLRSLVSKDIKSILSLYDRAIELARKNEFLQDEAMGNELAGKYLISMNLNKAAIPYITEARYLFRSWGADNKVKDIEKRYGDSLKADLINGSSDNGSEAADSYKFDINAVMKASHAISGEIILDKLLTQLMRILIENAGAQKGFLILQKEDGFYIEAEGSIDNDRVKVLRSLPVDESNEVSLSIINYIKRTHETVVLDDALNDSKYCRDTVIIKNRSRSVLSVPLIKQKVLKGLVYLENNLTVGAFPSGRIEIVKLLATQAAISLENAFLFEKTRKAENDLQQQYEEIQSQYEEMETMNEELETTYSELHEASIKLAAESETLLIFKRFAEASGQGFGMIDLKGKVTYANTAMCNILEESSVEKILDRDFRDYLPEKIKNIINDTILPVVRNEGQWIDELKLLTSRGKQVPVIQNVFIIRDNNKKAICYATVITDVSDLKKARDDLIASEERYRLLVETMNEGLAVADKKGVLNYCNSSFAGMLGLEKNEVLGRNFTEFLGEKNFKVFKEQIKLIRERKNEPYEIELTGRDGAQINVIISPKHIYDDRNKYAGTFAIVTDITERKKMEEEIFKTSKIKSLGIFAGGIAHDFNNFLTAIIGNISLSRLSLNKDDENFKTLTEAEDAAIRAKDLTQQLLTFSKGGVPVRKTVSIQELLKETVSFVLSGSNLNYEIEIDDDLWNVEVDEGQMGQVFHNIIINARQAMPHGGTIFISARNKSIEKSDGLPYKHKDYIIISIKDHGVGISRENLGNIFDPYFTTKNSGSGLGLAVTFSIIQKHEGFIRVHSEVGKGTTFLIYLPASGKDIKEKPDTVRYKFAGKGRALVMDDDRSVRNIAGKIIKYFGFEVDYAAHGQEVLDKYSESMKMNLPYDFVILDLTVPGKMGGKETVKHLLEIDPNVKAIVSSGYSNDPVMAKYSDYGFCAVIVKPYRVEELEEVLFNLLR